MKKKYLKPTTKVVEIKQRSHLLQQASRVTNNVGLNLGGPKNVPARSREARFDDGEWFEE